MAVLGSLVAGGEVVIDAAFEPDKWVSRIREFGATVSGGHGPMLEMIFAAPPSPDDSNHRVRTVCSAPFPRHIAREFEARFGVKGLEVWGMTEVGLPVWSDIDAPLREGSCGKVDDDWFEFAIVDPDTDAAVVPGETGEFVVRPKAPWTIMQGYDGMPEKTVEAWRNLWFHTGDIGYMDGGGHVYFVERASDRIRRRAENVSAYDIELAAMKHPGICEVAAIGVPSEFAGDDDIELCVVLHDGAEVEPLGLLGYLARALPHYMVPRYLRFIDALPRSATNKIQRALLKNAPRDPSVWDRKAHGVNLRDLIGPGT
jgi:crotonobetaine/carnitine-CoA ligase